MKCQQANIQRKKVDLWLPRAGEYDRLAGFGGRGLMAKRTEFLCGVMIIF